MGQSHRLPPGTYPPRGFDIVQKKHIFWQSMSLVDALHHLHRGLDWEEDHSFSCWPLDLKTQNVVVTLTQSHANENILFKISDSGLSNVKRLQESNTGEAPDETYALNQVFRRRDYASPTVARGGDTSKCLTPEAY